MRRVGTTVAKIRRTKTQAYTANWSVVSAAIIARDGHRCTRCGSSGSATNKLRAHHIIPVSKGGRTVPYNLKTVCDHCHELQPGHGHLRHR